jgi:Rrf2 family nitric oxide-sensitive transcriptional repressor
MGLTDHTDYSLRVLMYLNQKKTLVTLNELAENLQISKNNLIKVSNQLAKLGFVETVRGRSGGLVIHQDAGKLSLKAIVQETEENLNIADCFANKSTSCTFRASCRLKRSLNEALTAFLESLEKTTLDAITPGLSRGPTS